MRTPTPTGDATPGFRDARAEAADLLGPSQEPRVLEPSPPAVDDGAWFADDPVAADGARPDAVLVLPVSASPWKARDLRMKTTTWDALAADRPDVADFAAERWLGAWQRLPAVPGNFALTRDALHRVTFFVLSAARAAATGRIAVRATYRGLGTPFFGLDRQLRIEDTWLVDQIGNSVRAEPLTTLRRAAEFAGVDLDSGAGADFDGPALGDPDEPLAIDPGGATFLADWLGFGTSVLQEVRAAAGPDDKPSRVQLWAEHFDLSVEKGSEASGTRAGFGVSPGDAEHTEPYLYVGPWSKIARTDPFWNDDIFGGAVLTASDLADVDDQQATAVRFLEKGAELLTAEGTAN